jgi:hypothetical protein
MPWERARTDHARRVASVFRGQADRLDATARETQDKAHGEQLKGAAARLRGFAKDVQATPTRAQKVAEKLQRRRSPDTFRDVPEQER